MAVADFGSWARVRMDLADHFVGEAVNQTADSEHVDLSEQAMSPYRGQNGSWQGEEKRQEVNCGGVAEMIQQATRQDGADLIVRVGQICLIR
jgi:hypothetical protein